MIPRLVVTAVMMGLVTPVAASAQQLVYLVRHAERADQAASGQMMATDPPLSPAGEARAAKLAAMLKDAGVTAVYATEYKRTRDTAAPVAQAAGLQTQTNPARDTPGLVERLKSTHANGVVLVVGHSNSVPDIIKALGGPAVTIAETEYDNLFVLVPATGALSRIRY